MKKLTLLIAILLKVQLGNCQITFQKTFGGANIDAGYAVQQTTDGGYIITGWTQSFGAGTSDVYLIKTDSNGDTLWTKTFGGTAADVGLAIQQTTDGGYIITGWTQSFGAGSYDIYLIKTNSAGNLLWTKTIGGANQNLGYSVQQTTDGGYIINGNVQIIPFGFYYVHLIKTNANGDTLWTKTFGGTTGGEGWCVHQTTDGGYIITGKTTSFGSGAYDAYLMKTDVNGNLLWTKTYGNSNYDEGTSVQQTTDGGYIFTGGTTRLSSGYSDVLLIKTNSNGDTLWTKSFGGAYHDYGYSVKQTSDGGYIVAGRTDKFGTGSNDGYLIKTNANGDSLWTTTFDLLDNDENYSVQQTTDGGYIIAGLTTSFGVSDVYLIKTDANGNSGCNQGNLTTITDSSVIQLTSPTAMTYSPASNVNNAATIVGYGGIANTLCFAVGINEVTTNNLFFLSPNPSEGNFIISFEGTIMNGNIEILNVLGESVFTENIFNVSKKEINVKNISLGIYFVKVQTENGSVTKKIIKQ